MKVAGCEVNKESLGVGESGLLRGNVICELCVIYVIVKKTDTDRVGFVINWNSGLANSGSIYKKKIIIKFTHQELKFSKFDFQVGKFF